MRLRIQIEHELGNLNYLVTLFLLLTVLFVLFAILPAQSSDAGQSSATSDGLGFTITVILTKVTILGLSLYLLRLTLRAVPKIGDVALPKSRESMTRLGNWIYGVSGLVSAFVIGGTYSGFDVANRPLSIVAGICVIVNAIAVNYCIRQWNRARNAQRDIAKLLFRVSMLLTLAAIATAIAASDLLSSVGNSLSILLLPLSLEAVFVVRKST